MRGMARCCAARLGLAGCGGAPQGLQMQWSADSKESAFQCRGGRQKSDALQADGRGALRLG